MGVEHRYPEGFSGVGTLEDNSLYLLYNPSVTYFLRQNDKQDTNLQNTQLLPGLHSLSLSYSFTLFTIGHS